MYLKIDLSKYMSFDYSSPVGLCKFEPFDLHFVRHKLFHGGNMTHVFNCFCISVVEPEPKLEPELLAGAGAGASILKFRVRLPAPGQTKLVS